MNTAWEVVEEVEREAKTLISPWETWVFFINLVRHFVDENALKLYHDLKNKSVIELKYCLFEEFDGGLGDNPRMLGNLGWVNIHQVNEIVYMDLVN